MPPSPTNRGIELNANFAPSLWMSHEDTPQSLFTFSLKIDRNYLLAALGADPKDPYIYYATIEQGLKNYLDRTMEAISGGKTNSISSSLSRNSDITINIPAPAERALAMAKLFPNTTRKKGFIEPKENLPLRGADGKPPPANLQALLDQLNEGALEVVAAVLDGRGGSVWKDRLAATRTPTAAQKG